MDDLIQNSTMTKRFVKRGHRHVCRQSVAQNATHDADIAPFMTSKNSNFSKMLALEKLLK